ncbi:MAG: type II toxin-antitoxin system Phd/YefM family antitoxin [Planctomycetes bacterium]|nr:type II toxin-antitoxin system Phd/YefM family antitoxin [Planctomycetota bacterium]
MKSVEFRNAFKQVCDKANAGDIIFITRPKGGNVVLLSESAYNRMTAAKRKESHV